MTDVKDNAHPSTALKQRSNAYPGLSALLVKLHRAFCFFHPSRYPYLAGVKSRFNTITSRGLGGKKQRNAETSASASRRGPTATPAHRHRAGAERAFSPRSGPRPRSCAAAAPAAGGYSPRPAGSAGGSAPPACSRREGPEPENGGPAALPAPRPAAPPARAAIPRVKAGSQPLPAAAPAAGSAPPPDPPQERGGPCRRPPAAAATASPPTRSPSGPAAAAGDPEALAASCRGGRAASCRCWAARCALAALRGVVRTPRGSASALSASPAFGWAPGGGGAGLAPRGRGGPAAVHQAAGTALPRGSSPQPRGLETCPAARSAAYHRIV